MLRDKILKDSDKIIFTYPQIPFFVIVNKKEIIMFIL